MTFSRFSGLIGPGRISGSLSCSWTSITIGTKLWPHPPKDAQAALDQAVQQAYGMPADQEATEFLLELNKLVAEDEAEGRAVQGSGVHKGLNPRDPRWISDDCIMPPKS